MLMKVKVLAAGISDVAGAQLLLVGLVGVFPRMALVWVDYAYRGLTGWLKAKLGWKLEVVKHWWSKGKRVAKGQKSSPKPEGFQVLPRRWVVERTFAWLGRNRRLSKDYEALPETEEAFVYASMVRLMLRRLTAPP